MNRVCTIILLVTATFFTIGCKKTILVNPEKRTPTSIDRPVDRPDYSQEELVKQSVFYYTKLFSLWTDAMPPQDMKYLDDKAVLQSYTKDYRDGEEVLNYLTSLTPPFMGKPVDRYSFLDREGEVSNEIQEGVSSSYGLYVSYLQTSTSGDNSDLYVQMVDKNSPAYVAGLRRGDRILSINGNTNIDYKTQKSQDFKMVDDAIYYSKSVMLKVVSPAGVVKDAQLTSTLYNMDPILSSKVFEQNGKKIGYLAFSSFVSVSEDGANTAMYAAFEQVFRSFELQNISELIVDIRYNGGGAVNTAEYLANCIAPASATGHRMLTYKVNATMESWGDTEKGAEFGPVDFSKKGTLNLGKVYFLVTRSTASASELLINVLKPYFGSNLLVIGGYGQDENGNRIAENTYGKPVGFFGYRIVDGKTDLFVTSFQMFNKDNYGEYFNGLVPDRNTSEDYFKDFGDPQEGMIAEALTHSRTGNWVSPTTSRAALASVNKAKNERNIRVRFYENKRRVSGMYKFIHGPTK